jgi:hypothetical protein
MATSTRHPVRVLLTSGHGRILSPDFQLTHCSIVGPLVPPSIHCS